MTPEQARAVWAAMTDDQRADLARQVQDIAAFLNEHGDRIDRAIAALGADLAIQAERYANEGKR